MAAPKKPMTKSQIVAHFAEKFEIPRKTAASILQELVDLSVNETKKVGAQGPHGPQPGHGRADQDPGEDRGQDAALQVLQGVHRPAEEEVAPWYGRGPERAVLAAAGARDGCPARLPSPPGSFSPLREILPFRLCPRPRPRGAAAVTPLTAREGRIQP